MAWAIHKLTDRQARNATAKWLADRYPQQQDFLPTDAAALWASFFTIANTTD